MSATRCSVLACYRLPLEGSPFCWKHSGKVGYRLSIDLAASPRVVEAARRGEARELFGKVLAALAADGFEIAGTVSVRPMSEWDR